jgi:hypothetical protein
VIQISCKDKRGSEQSEPIEVKKMLNKKTDENSSVIVMGHNDL